MRIIWVSKFSELTPLAYRVSLQSHERPWGDWRGVELISLTASPLANFLGARGKKRLYRQISLATESRHLRRLIVCVLSAPVFYVILANHGPERARTHAYVSSVFQILFWSRDVLFENTLIHLFVMERTLTHTFTSMYSLREFLTTLARGNPG